MASETFLLFTSWFNPTISLNYSSFKRGLSRLNDPAFGTLFVLSVFLHFSKVQKPVL